MFGNNKEKQLTEYADKLLADDILSDDDQHNLFEFARSLGLDFNEYLNKHPATQDRVIIAGINAGRFPGAAPPYHILVKPGEEVLVEAPAFRCSKRLPIALGREAIPGSVSRSLGACDIESGRPKATCSKLGPSSS